MATSKPDFEKFWDLIENKFGCTVPKYLQNILALQGFDNALNIKTLKQDDYEFLQEYVRNDMNKRIPKDADLRDYYDTFHETPEEFVFLRGHLRLLEEIVFIINKTIASKGYDIFNIHKTKSQTAKNRQGKIDVQYHSDSMNSYEKMIKCNNSSYGNRFRRAIANNM